MAHVIWCNQFAKHKHIDPGLIPHPIYHALCCNSQQKTICVQFATTLHPVRRLVLHYATITVAKSNSFVLDTPSNRHNVAESNNPLMCIMQHFLLPNPFCCNTQHLLLYFATPYTGYRDPYLLFIAHCCDMQHN